MTVDREKLREVLAQFLFQQSEYPILYRWTWRDAVEASTADPRHRAADAVRHFRMRAAGLMSGPLAPILAQADGAERVAAERDEARALIDAARGEVAKWPEFEGDNLAGMVFGLVGAARHATMDERGSQFILEHLVRVIDACRELETEVTRLSAEVERLRAALKPFGAPADTWVVHTAARMLGIEATAFIEAGSALSTPGTDAPAAAQEGSE